MSSGRITMKTVLKTIVRILSSLLVLPAVGIYSLHSGISGRERAFPGWSQLFSLVPGQTGVYLRQAFYRFTLKRCDEDASIGFGTIFSHPGAAVGRTAYIGNFCSIGDVQIGDDALIASHVSIMNGCRQHSTASLELPVREQAGVYEPVTIGRDAWIGERATVAASVGNHCVIGAGALVLTPIPDYAIAVGVPAKVIRHRRAPNERSGPEPDVNTVS
ncbi:MAG: acyltransferase [Planctomycetaceae bacterium]